MLLLLCSLENILFQMKQLNLPFYTHLTDDRVVQSQVHSVLHLPKCYCFSISNPAVQWTFNGLEAKHDLN